eukprot:1560107-Karenia_brevis.AAC.1
MVEDMLKKGSENHDLMEPALLFLFAYIFLLRVPSEAIPARHGVGSSKVYIENDELVLELEKRKHLPQGSRLVRK